MTERVYYIKTTIDVFPNPQFPISTIPRIPTLFGVSTKRSNLLSIEYWIQQFKAHLNANSWEENLFKDILSWTCEAAVFSVLVYLLKTVAEVTYNDIKIVLRQRFCGDGYEGTLAIWVEKSKKVFKRIFPNIYKTLMSSLTNKSDKGQEHMNRSN